MLSSLWAAIRLSRQECTSPWPFAKLGLMTSRKTSATGMPVEVEPRHRQSAGLVAKSGRVCPTNLTQEAEGPFRAVDVDQVWLKALDDRRASAKRGGGDMRCLQRSATPPKPFLARGDPR